LKLLGISTSFYLLYYVRLSHELLKYNTIQYMRNTSSVYLFGSYRAMQVYAQREFIFVRSLIRSLEMEDR